MENTLYEQLGEENLKQLVDTFYAQVKQDERIQHLFQTDIEVVKQKQFMFLTQFFGGPPLYNAAFGHPKMRMRHLPHKITKDAAVAWLENMKIAVESLSIEESLKIQLFNSFPRLAVHMVNS